MVHPVVPKSDGARRHRALPYVVGAMAPGRNLVAAEPGEVNATQDYLVHCVEVAHEIGAPTVGGPFCAATGRTWRMEPDERTASYTELCSNLAPVVAAAESAGVTRGRTAQPLRDQPLHEPATPAQMAALVRGRSTDLGSHPKRQRTTSASLVRLC